MQVRIRVIHIILRNRIRIRVESWIRSALNQNSRALKASNVNPGLKKIKFNVLQWKKKKYHIGERKFHNCQSSGFFKSVGLIGLRWNVFRCNKNFIIFFLHPLLFWRMQIRYRYLKSLTNGTSLHWMDLSSVADPDPNGSSIIWLSWIRICKLTEIYK